MKIESLPSEVYDVVLNNDGLKMYLNNLERGRSATPRSWLYEGKSDTEVLQAWLTILETVKSSEFGELIYQFDTSQLKKWGAQGEVKPIKELMEIVTEGFTNAGTPKPAIWNTPMWQQAKTNAIKYLIIDTGLYKRLRPRALSHVVDDMRDRDTLESNSGFPDFGRRKKPEILTAAFEAIKSGEFWEFPAIVLFRNYNQKTRIVWMYPMATNIYEGSFTQPLKEALMKSDLDFIAPWRGYDHVLARLSKLYGTGEFLSASDFSHTDAHFTKWAILEVYDVIKYAFQEQYWDELKRSMLHVVEIPLIIGENSWIIGDHGVSSGSNWTNDVETYMDFIIAQYLTLLKLVKEPCMAIGDDISHRRDSYLPDLDEQIAQVCQSMGFDVNAEKVTNQQDWVKFLQRLTIRGFNSERTYSVEGVEYPLLRGIYSTIRALNSSLNPEKFHSPKLWSKDMFAVRQFMILENCIDHPLFVQFVKFVCAGNPYLVKFAKLKNEQIDKKWAQSRILPGLNPTYNQEKRDKPLSTYAAIAIARSL
ncbi:RNA dependent RNA polymerase [Picobirnavirus Equ3]|uniref:RNA dependent RNA polymerase n=1 Tax=Picobirnavirus Equ3 TaxID=1673646 RepID=A0A0H4AKZ0_9VIRU|nr:RNA dependent RNA polymerase [Picobirnavirus Equ3]AKN50624.1 RNA dependent RNA polymerase [Picobirnavirus Equ3]